MRYLTTTIRGCSTTLVSASLDGAIEPAKEKNTKITASFVRSPLKTTTLGILAVIFVFFSLAGVASANEPWWHLESGTRPSYLPPEGGCKTPEGKAEPCEVIATVTNLGDASTSGEVTIVDTLPAGLTAKAVEGEVLEGEGGHGVKPVVCSPNPKTERPLTCTIAGVLGPYDAVEMRIHVEVQSGAKVEPEGKVCRLQPTTCEQNQVSVSGGEAPALSISRPVTISEESAPFGVETYEVAPEEEGGAPTVQAGQHPFQITGTLTVNQTAPTLSVKEKLEAHPVALAKDLAGLLPPGLIGNPTPFVKCTVSQLDAKGCPPASVIGVATITVNEPVSFGGLATFTSPIAIMQPAHGEAARFGFFTAIVPVYLEAHVRSGGDYGITLGSTNIPQVASFLSYKLTFWGVPGVSSHNSARSQECLSEAHEQAPVGTCKPFEAINPPPFLAMPTFCPAKENPETHQSEPERLYTSTEADAWDAPEPEGSRLIVPETELMPAMIGCARLPFNPEIKITPDGSASSTATGVRADVHVPQESILNATSLAQSDVRGITVALPLGVALNPSDAGGLEACSSNPASLLAEGKLGSPGDQIGFEGERGFETSPGLEKLPAFTPKKPGSFGTEGAEATLRPGLNFCSTASKIATVEIKSPLLPAEQPLKGSVYLAEQESNPFSSLLAMYIVAEDPVSGTLVKLPGEVQLCKGAGEVIETRNAQGKAIARTTCQGLGQIVTTFQNNPQLAFEDAELHFFGGERSPLATPSQCGAYTTTASFVPWTAEPATATTPGDEAALTVNSESHFEITTGPKTPAYPQGGPCPGPLLPFAPTATGGATNVQAAAFSPFTATFSRQDGEQNMKSVQAVLPPGLSGVLTGVELCPEPQANQGLCGPNSLIGETTVSVGVGGQPYSVRGGKFYLTGPYNGTSGCNVVEPGCAPFGLSFVVPAKAGPFDFAKTQNNHPACDCVLVRGKIEINPYTSALTITSNPAGTTDSIPTELEGIPLEIQHINATTTRGNFQFNPSNCNKTQATATINTTEGFTDTINVPFQVTNCGALKFQPTFTVSTKAKTSKADGASLTAKVTYPNVPQGTDADIGKVKVELPLQLPSRLTTLQKACTTAQFEANPAGCPSASDIGFAVVHTPLIPVPLTGPAIFVSHGGEAFPSLEIVLQGYGLKIILVGTTFISKAGITSTTFKTVPDQPFSTFELTLPEGPYSALAANGNLCAPTATKTVSKKVKVKVHGKTKTVTRKVKETVAGSLTMPNEFIGQNGAEIHQITTIKVEGCPKAKPAKKAKKKAKGKKGGKKKK
jgi:hypothetical protein